MLNYLLSIFCDIKIIIKMLKKSNIKLLIILICIIITSGYLFISLSIGKDSKLISNNLKKLLNNEQKELIKKYIFPYKFISQQQQKLDSVDWDALELFSLLKENKSYLELLIKKSNIDIALFY